MARRRRRGGALAARPEHLGLVVFLPRNLLGWLRLGWLKIP